MLLTFQPMPDSSVIFLHIHSPTWLAICHTVVDRELEFGRKVSVVNIASFLEPSGAVFSQRWDSSALRRFRRNMRERGVEVFDLQPKSKVADTSHLKANHNISESLESHLATWMRTPNPSSTLLGKFLGWKVLRKVAQFEAELQHNMWILSATYFFIPSGRSPLTGLIGNLVSTETSNVHWIETELTGGLFLQPYRRHDRMSTRKHFEQWQKGCTHDHTASGAWLQSRTNLDSRHTWSMKFDSHSKAQDFENVFFPSSPDEYLHLDDYLNETHWDSHYDAFSSILGKLDPSGSRSVLRLHPIFRTKSLRQIMQANREIRKLRSSHPELSVFYSESKVNSYDLIRGARRVFVSRSTLAFEAAYLGKPVWQTMHHILDGCLAVETIFSESDVEKSTFDGSNLNLERSVCALEFMLDRSSPIKYKDLYRLRRVTRVLVTLDSALTLCLVWLWRGTYLYPLLPKPRAPRRLTFGQ